MRKYLNPHTLADDARMRRASFKGTFLYVEGESDQRLYGMFTDDYRCQTIIAHTRSNVIEACRILETVNFPGAIGIIDADFDHLEDNLPDVASVFQTDMHDGECLMLSTIAFDKLLYQFASQQKLREWLATYGTDFRAHLVSQAALIGCLLWYSNRERLNLCFEGLEAKEYSDSASLKIDLGGLVRHVKNKSSCQALPDGQLINGLQERLEIATNDLWQATRGHDFIDLLSFALRKALGSRQALDVTRDRLELALRLAYSEDEFCRTELYAQVRVWEETHIPFRVFREPHQM